jgi:D-amino peptidase
MKIYLSADIEGTATTNIFDDCIETYPQYAYHCEEMTSEVIAACEGAIAAGASEIIVNDAHGPASNIDPKRLPACCKIIRKWTGHPYIAVEGIDSSFDAVMFVGYHSGASSDGNPLSHTISPKFHYMKINGHVASEFMIFSYCAALEGISAVYLSGDKKICDESKTLYPKIVTTAVKEAIGATTIALAPAMAIKQIRADSERALLRDFSHDLLKLPEHFSVEILYNNFKDAYKAGFYPGARQVNEDTVLFDADNFFEVMRFINFIIYLPPPWFKQ